eukprot:scaffold1068_cov375-Prasinococcus_capsulatus_cf.AAC.10
MWSSRIKSEIVEIEEELKQARMTKNSNCEELETELGDLLFDTFLLAQICERDIQDASLDGAAAAACAKIRRRCAYQFGAERAETKEDALKIWMRVKQEEKQGLHKREPDAVRLFRRQDASKSSLWRAVSPTDGARRGHCSPTGMADVARARGTTAATHTNCP